MKSHIQSNMQRVRGEKQEGVSWGMGFDDEEQILAFQKQQEEEGDGTDENGSHEGDSGDDGDYGEEGD